MASVRSALSSLVSEGRDVRPQEPRVPSSHLCVSKGVTLTQEEGKVSGTPGRCLHRAGTAASPPGLTRALLLPVGCVRHPLPPAPSKDSWLWEGVGMWNAGGSPINPHDPNPYRTRAGMAELIKAEFQV